MTIPPISERYELYIAEQEAIMAQNKSLGIKYCNDCDRYAPGNGCMASDKTTYRNRMERGEMLFTSGKGMLEIDNIVMKLYPCEHYQQEQQE